jgi:hypothetical protein
VFENRVLRRIFGSKRDNVTGEWRRLYKEELKDLYSSPIVVRVIKSRRMRWTEHVHRIRARRDTDSVLKRKFQGNRPVGKPRVDGRIILKWIFEKWDGAWTGLIWLIIGTGGGLLRMR